MHVETRRESCWCISLGDVQYFIGSIFVKFNTSYIAEGATVLGSSQQKAFPLMQLDGARFLLGMQGMLQLQVLATALSCHLCWPWNNIRNNYVMCKWHDPPSGETTEILCVEQKCKSSFEFDFQQ